MAYQPGLQRSPDRRDSLRRGVWIAEKGKFIVKMEMTPPDGKPIKMLEVKQVSFTPPLDSYFVTPSNCDTQAQGR